MRTMSLQRLLNNIIFFILFFQTATLVAAETSWEVATVFLGEGESQLFQQDIDKNIIELTQASPGSNLKLGIYREMNGLSTTYVPTDPSNTQATLSDLMYRKDLKKYKIPGLLKSERGRNLQNFLANFFSKSKSKRALFIYSHGSGPLGLSSLKTQELKSLLAAQTPSLDLLWLDACFMANIEFLFELRNNSKFTIASEESEFSSGLPFDSINLLPKFSSGKEASIFLARNFIESYSYIKSGTQRSYVNISSATISVIDNSKLMPLVNLLKVASPLFESLSEIQKDKILKTLSRNASMDDHSLVDLGSLMIELRKLINDETADRDLTSIIRMLNIDSIKSLKTNPRIHLHSPESQSILVFGFNDWSYGKEVDFGKNENLKLLLSNDGFINGPINTQWPFKKLYSSELVISPFAPGINTFNYYFISAEGKRLSNALSFARTHDYVESNGDNSTSPLIYTAYTQQLGIKAERYTGINIAIPRTAPSLDYFELEFNRLAHWLSL